MTEYICSNLSKLINASGLVLDIIGVILLWKFGLPESINRQGHSYICWDGVDTEEINKAAKYDKLAKLALTLIILGFVLQFISDFT